jgi:hypothetical protein
MSFFLLGLVDFILRSIHSFIAPNKHRLYAETLTPYNHIALVKERSGIYAAGMLSPVAADSSAGKECFET